MDCLALWFCSFEPGTLNWPNFVAAGTAEGQEPGYHSHEQHRKMRQVEMFTHIPWFVPAPLHGSSGELRWNSPSSGQGQSWVWTGMDSRNGLCSTGQVQKQQSPAEMLEWSWNCPKLLPERGPATEPEQKGFEHLVTTRQSHCCYAQALLLISFTVWNPAGCDRHWTYPSKSSSGLPKNVTQHSRVADTERDAPSPAVLQPKPTVKDAPSKQCKEKGRGTTLNGIISPSSFSYDQTRLCTEEGWRTRMSRFLLWHSLAVIPGITAWFSQCLCSQHIFTVI